jgi:hypothetical protein
VRIAGKNRGWLGAHCRNRIKMLKMQNEAQCDFRSIDWRFSNHFPTKIGIPMENWKNIGK